jgi:glucose/arabinose dehydrogenase
MGVVLEGLEGRRLLAVVPAGFSDQIIADGLNSPTSMVVAPDGRIFVAEQGGTIRVIKGDTLLTTPFHTFTDLTDDFEMGLLGIELDPNFASNGYVYAFGTTVEGGLHNRVMRLTSAGDVADPASRVNLIDFPPLNNAIFHMGGAMHFGVDGKLYVALGDHQYFDGAKLQTLEVPFGKILRFNADGSIPTDNPFYDQAGGLNRATWVYGLRNPFTFDIQPGTGRMFINDVGQDHWEEINEGIAGANYGWPESEGPDGADPFTAPIYYYGRDEGIAVTGALFYNPTTQHFPDEYVGRYFFGDVGSGFIRTLDPDAGNTVSPFATGLVAPVDFDLAPDGSLYYLQRGFDLNQGSVGRIRFDDALNKPRIDIPPQSQSRALRQSVTFSVTASGPDLSYQWRQNGRTLAGETGSSLKLASIGLADAGQYQVRVTNRFGSVLSEPATLTVLNELPPTAKIVSPVSGSLFRAGQTLVLDGRGNDPEDGKLGPSKFTWQVDYHTGSVVRPFLPATTGQRRIQLVIPTETPYTRPNVFYRMKLTVKDSAGAGKTVTRDLRPITARVKLTTNIGPVMLTLDEQPKTSPKAFTGVAGIKRVIGAPQEVTVNGVAYEFDHWSDGGTREHEISTPTGPATYIARYRRALTVNAQHILTPTADAYVLGGAPTQNFGAATSLLAKSNHQERFRRETYLKFDLGEVTGPIRDAKLRLFAHLGSNSDQNVKVGAYYAPGAKWNEKGLTYANRPATRGKAAAGAVINDTAGQWYELDITTLLQREFAQGRRIITLVVRTQTISPAIVHFSSREELASQPQLMITT